MTFADAIRGELDARIEAERRYCNRTLWGVRRPRPSWFRRLLARLCEVFHG